MELTLKKGKRNLQPIYDSIVEGYSRVNLDEMKRMSKEFIIEMRVNKIKAYRFNESVDKIKSKDKLLIFITNLHMQDMKETSGLSKI
jgi:hypothetical protein|tara:strand:- start:1089 stop:1349 length:261 start_codon:yes stop_codon:yes gene_type:complete